VKKIVAVVLSVAFSFCAFAQKELKPKLIAGPIVGSVTKNSAKVWIAYQGKGQNLLILGDTSEKRIYYPTNLSYITNAKGEVALTMDFTGLKPNHLYNVLISIDGWGANARCSFKTQADTDIKDFNFLLGSCALMNTDILRGIFPGGSSWIFYRMKKKQSDFMVWLGDNIYYLYAKHYASYDAMFNRNIDIRKSFKKFREFLSTQPNYAIWDDHDYGPNDSDKSFVLKDSSLKIFKGMWPNTYPEGEQFHGNYFNFRYYDAEFFMTDDRFFRDPEGDSTGAFLGETQLVWLKNKLLMSDAAFKFIAVGTQILNDNHFGESYAEYKKERNDLLDFISKNNIKGVVFLTGDKHYSELSKRDWNGYPMYDFTCSPLTSPPLPRRLLGAYNNSYRVPDSDYGRKNFGRINVSGTKGNRSLKIEIYSRTGRQKRSFVLNENDLSRK
jgi:alkaline phosphatase D